MAEQTTHFLFGSTNDSSCIPTEMPPTFDPLRYLEATPLEPLTNIKALEGQYLAEVLEVWECYDDFPLHNSPILLRFEEIDLLVVSDDTGKLSLWLGAIDTEQCLDDFQTQPENEDIDQPEHCLYWMSHPELQELVGQQAYSITRTENEEIQIVFDEMDVLFFE